MMPRFLKYGLSGMALTAVYLGARNPMLTAEVTISLLVSGLLLVVGYYGVRRIRP